MTARPSGAFCSPPSPEPKAMGIMPMIIASAVMITGLSRVAPAFAGKPVLTAEQIEDVVAYLVTLRD